jgi:hypothetical protein
LDEPIIPCLQEGALMSIKSLQLTRLADEHAKDVEPTGLSYSGGASRPSRRAA